MTEPNTTAQRLTEFLEEIGHPAYATAIADAILADPDIVAAIAAHRPPSLAAVEQQFAAIDMVSQALAEHFTFPQRVDLTTALDRLRDRVGQQANADRAIGEHFARLNGVTPPDTTQLGALIRAAVTATGAPQAEPATQED